MSFNVTITRTSGKGTLEVPPEVAEVLAETYAALATLPVNNAANLDFNDGKTLEENIKAARLFSRQAAQWAETEGLKYQRKGDIKGLPTRVTFRVYKPNPDEKRGAPKGTSKTSKK